MSAIKLKDGVYWVGANVQTEDLFEGIWPIPHGVALNSYVVKGEKTAVVELVREWGGAALTFIRNLESIPVKIEDIDYVILDHLEPDHTGFTYMVNSLSPGLQFVTTKKGAELLREFYGIEDNVIVVGTDDELNLGNGKKLHFTEIPNVHWPETMVTYEEESKTLFSGDAFGAFGVHRGTIFDDKTSDASKSYWESEMLRYYANIVSMFSPQVDKAIEKLEDVDIDIVAPAHGLVWRGKPEVVIKKYKRYASYNQDYAEPQVCVVWGSMYGNTEVMLNAILRGVSSQNVPVTVYRVPNDDVSFILSDVYKSAGLIIGTPTYEYDMFPPMKYLMDLLKKKHIWYKKALFFGSFGWSGGAERVFNEMTERMKWDLYDPLPFKGYPNAEELEKGEELAAQLAADVKEIPSKIGDEDY
ncbi:MAG: FprA family A-type flavoprotein [Promethearchaeia archaeon]